MMGWFGFNAGSALSSGASATSAVVSTQIAACTSGMIWLFASWIRRKPSTIAIINGVIAGLAGITPASGYVDSQSTIAIGIIIGLGSYFSLILIKEKLKIDDALDVSSVHGVTGILGSLSIGIFGQETSYSGGANGLIYGGGFKLLGIQALGVGVALVYSAIITFFLGLLIIKCGLRVDENEEELGIDWVEHREIAYHELMDDDKDVEGKSKVN